MGSPRSDHVDHIDHTAHYHSAEGYCVLTKRELEDQPPRQWRWLESTKALQRDTFGIPFDPHNDRRVAMTVKENVLPAIVELTELLSEVSWKYWAHDAPFVNRLEVIREAVDVMHFVGNILVAMDVTDDEWEREYMAKQAENRRRQREGYEVREK
jgi:hypothetical protein